MKYFDTGICEVNNLFYLHLQEIKNTGGGFRLQENFKEFFLLYEKCPTVIYLFEIKFICYCLVTKNMKNGRQMHQY